MDDAFAGILTIEIYMPGNSSLKDKRRIVKSLMERIRNRFHVAVSEIAANDLWQRAVIGIACVSADRGEARRVMDLVMQWIDRQDEFEVTASSIEIR